MIKTVGSKTQTPSARMVVTGFPPFSSVTRNPSEVLVTKLAEQAWQPAPDCQVDYIILPMVQQDLCASVENLLSQDISEKIPQIVVHFGVAVQATGFRLERYARNVFQDQKPSPAHGQSNAQSPSQAILKTSTATSKTVEGMVRINTAQELGDCRNNNLPWAEIQHGLHAETLPYYMSEDAGTYYCNMASYLTALTAKTMPALRSGFVHLPLLVGDEHIAQNCDVETPFFLPCDKMLQGAKIILQKSWDNRQSERR